MTFGRGRVHDRAVLDALEAAAWEAFHGHTWRVTRNGRDPLRGSSASGRWNPPGEFEALYTRLIREGAVAEIGYRLSLEPVWPSRVQHSLHRIEVETHRTLRLAELASLSSLGASVGQRRTSVGRMSRRRNPPHVRPTHPRRKALRFSALRGLGRTVARTAARSASPWTAADRGHRGRTASRAGGTGPVMTSTTIRPRPFFQHMVQKVE